MSSIQEIAHTNFRIDTENPRLPEYKKSQREALQELLHRLRRKILSLTRDIVRHGLNPAELPIVMPDPNHGGRYIVLEGNRRVIALRVLENPTLAADQLTASQRSRLHSLAEEYQNEPIETVLCVVVGSREEARHWIHLRHTGENQGAGLVPWAAEERARFLERGGRREPYRQVLDFLSRREELSPEERRQVPVTSLRRLLSTPEVRDKMGLELRKGVLSSRLPEDEVAKGLLRVLDDLVSGEINTKDIYHAEDRRKYIDEIPAKDLPSPSTAGKKSQALDEVGTPGRRSGKRRKGGGRDKGFPTQRRTLIPSSCSLTIGEARIRRIAGELRKLRVRDYSNAASVLFRVFLELTLDAHTAQSKLAVKPNYKLRHKLLDVANHLGKENKLSKDQLKPIRRAAHRTQAFPGASIAAFNEYVHSRALQPNTEDLFTAWEELQPLFEAIWS